MKPKKVFADNEKRISSIQRKMEAEHSTPVAVYGYYATQTEACKLLKCTPAELNKAIARNGSVHGLKVYKGEMVDIALSKFIQLNDIKNQKYNK